MSTQAVLLPLLVQVALTFALGFWMAGMRVQAIRSGKVRRREVALREPNWPPHILKVQNAFHNQLELPVLFYLLIIVVWTAHTADLLFVLLAWLYVALRLTHAYLHVTANDMARRGMVFIASAVVLCVMWIISAVEILIRA